jgi:[acyl-carrier-protein] S-malonyltransferase
LMQPAADGMSSAIARMTFRPPSVPIVANTTAQPVISIEAIQTELRQQLCNCVQWQKSVEYMLAEGVTTFIEIGPGKVLAGLIKRTSREAAILNVGDAGSVKSFTI